MNRVFLLHTTNADSAVSVAEIQSAYRPVTSNPLIWPNNRSQGCLAWVAINFKKSVL